MGKSPVERFLESRGPTKCLTCAGADRFADHIEEFREARELGVNKSWREFHRVVLVGELDYPLGYQALLQHLKNCLQIQP